jgi:hypothetical protein
MYFFLEFEDDVAVVNTKEPDMSWCGFHVNIVR